MIRLITITQSNQNSYPLLLSVCLSFFLLFISVCIQFSGFYVFKTGSNFLFNIQFKFKFYLNFIQRLVLKDFFAQRFSNLTKDKRSFQFQMKWPIFVFSMSHFAFFASDVYTQDFWVGEGYPAGKTCLKLSRNRNYSIYFFKGIVILILFFPIIGKLNAEIF